MVMGIFLEDNAELRDTIFGALLDQVPEIKSVYYCVNQKLNDSYYDQDFHHYAGSEKLEQQLGHVTFEIGPKSFFQTNAMVTTRGSAMAKVILGEAHDIFPASESDTS